MNQIARLATVALAAAIGSVALAQAAPSPQQAAPISVEAYWLRVQDTMDTVEALGQADPATVRTRLDEEASSWETVTQVQVAGGTVIPVDSSYLVSLLRADPPDLGVIHKYLVKLLDASQTWKAGDVSSGQPVDWSERLAGVLARDEFNWDTPAQPDPIQEWLDQLMQRFFGWLDNLFPSGVVIGIPIFEWVFVLIGVLVLAAILIYVLRGLAGSLAEETDLQNGDDGLDEVVSAEVAARRAEETARLGDYRSAVRWLYLSSLLILDERGLLRYDRTRTNREYLRSVAHLSELSAALREVIDVFDRVWYGFSPIGETDFRRYAGRVAELRRIK